MQTRFSPAQLADPPTADAAGAIRSCVHCGFCTATCPTYVLLGDELDSPRGRIYLVKEMLEKGVTPSAEVVKHVDRCLSCLSCESHCPSGVSYRRVIEKGRAYIEENYQRPLGDRLVRAMLTSVLPYRQRFRAALMLASLARPLAGLFDELPALRPIATMLRLTGASRASRPAASGGAVMPAGKPKTLRVGLARGCIEPVLDPAIQAATERLLARAGCEVVRARNDGCCGSLSHHMGREAQALQMARANVDAWDREIHNGGLTAIVLTASGCGTLIRDYGHFLKDDPAYAAKAARVAALACDLTELLERIGLPQVVLRDPLVVGYHPACSLQHGQQVRTAPMQMLTAAGFTVRLPVDSHLCCGSAGVYNILQPEIAGKLGARKAETLAALHPDVIATGNIGCRVQISQTANVPVVHVAELLDWATGGPKPF